MSSNYRPGDEYRTYPYAKDEAGNLVHVSEVSKEDGGKFYCLGCGSEMIARLGHIVNHHFAHKSISKCSGETVLHHAAKMVFFNTYKKCLEREIPFKIGISYQVKCVCKKYKDCKQSSTKTNYYDLTEFFNKVELESWHDGFRPDVKLFSDKTDSVLFVEIAVFHKVEDRKRDSGHRIIEIDINSASDIERIARIPEEPLTESMSVAFFNMRNAEKDTTIMSHCLGRHCENYCRHINNMEYEIRNSHERDVSVINKKYNRMVYQYRLKIDSDRQDEIQKARNRYYDRLRALSKMVSSENNIPEEAPPVEDKVPVLINEIEAELSESELADLMSGDILEAD